MTRTASKQRKTNKSENQTIGASHSLAEEMLIDRSTENQEKKATAKVKIIKTNFSICFLSIFFYHSYFTKLSK